jgi:L-ribulose-5-phosphate 3-epimerase
MGKLRLGVMTGLNENIYEELKKISDLGLDACQAACWNPDMYTNEMVSKVKQASADTGVEVTLLWTGYPGPAVWNFTQGPATIGLVPSEYRRIRIDALKAGADFAYKCGIKTTATHAGFIPENPADSLYIDTLEALKEVALHCQKLGITFCFETGQETPVTLLRMIKDIGTDNLGVNLDPANLLLYGKANPVDALDILGPYIKGVHAKDGEYPTNPNELGVEKALGEGKVNFPVLIPKLKSFGYNGSLTIEREISGPQQIIDIKHAIELLNKLS